MPWPSRFFRPMRSARRPRSCRPRLEMLEPRDLPALVFASDRPVTIPAFDIVRSTLEIRESIDIADLNVRLNVQHPVAGMVGASLFGPDGTWVELVPRSRAPGANLENTILDDEADGPSIAVGEPPYHGAFHPVEPLSRFDGMLTQGLWTLVVTNSWHSPGELLDWSMEVVPTPTLQGQVWEDLDANGLRGHNEPGMADIRLFLDDNANGQLDANEPTTWTDRNGQYEFRGLSPGPHLVVQDLPDALFQTTPAPHPVRELFHADFEAGDDGFTSSGQLDQWHRSTGGSEVLGHSASHSWYFGSGEGPQGGGEYAADAEGTLFSPLIDLTDVESSAVQLEFRHQLASHWRTWASVGVLAEGVETILAEWYEGVGSTGTVFDLEQVDLSAFAGREVQLFFRFTTTEQEDVTGGWYIDDVVVRELAHVGQFVFLSPGQIQDGLDFGNQQRQQGADLVAESFEVVERTGVWGENVTLRYTLANQGPGNAGPFQVAVRLSADGQDQNAEILDQIQIPGLAGGARISDTLEVQLPGTASNLPAGFSELGEVYLGLHLDLLHQVGEIDETNNLGQGLGKDLDRLVLVHRFSEQESNDTPAQATPVSVPFRVDGSMIHQADQDFYRFEVVSSGRLRVSLQGDTSQRLGVELSTPSGEVLVRSETEANWVRGGIDQHVLPGIYLLTVNPALGAVPTNAATGYRLEVEFTASPSPLTPQQLGSSAVFQLARDLNSDGHLDLIVADHGSSPDQDGKVMVLLGNGDGSFQARRMVSSWNGTTPLVTADVNSDGRLDLIVASGDEDHERVSVLLGKDDGSFLQTTSYRVVGDPISAQVMDVNNDGHLDLIVASQGRVGDGNVSVQLGNGDGSFQDPIRYWMEESPTVVEVADVNSDGFLDLLIVGQRSNDEGQLSVLLGQGDGSFQAQMLLPVAQARLFVDVNNDGFLDLIVAFRGLYPDPDAQVRVRLGQGDGTFQQPTSYIVGQYSSSSPVIRLEAVDVNNDGFLDLLNQYADDVSVLLGNGDGTFQQPTPYLVGQDPITLNVVDVNDDGISDLLVGSRGSYSDYNSAVSVRLGNGDGSFQEPTNSFLGRILTSVEVVDVNNDGIPDLLVGSLGPYPDHDPTVSVWLGKGDGSWKEPTSYPLGQGSISLEAVDINNDGFLDLLVGSRGSDVSYYRGSVSVLLNQEDGSFLETTSYPVEGQDPILEVVDVNSDGFLDLLVLNQYADDVSVLLGQGDGTFHPPTSYPVGSHPTAVEAVDINNDGFLDLLVVNQHSDDLSVLLGQEDGSFHSPTTYLVPNFPTSLEVLDVNSDGFLDVITGNHNSDNVGVLLGRGDGSFQSTRRYSVGSNPTAAAVADVNRDGFLDLLIVGQRSNSEGQLSVLLGEGGGSFQDPTHYWVRISPTAVEVADVNSDGFLDLLIVGTRWDTEGQLSVLLGRGDGSFQAQMLVTPPPARLFVDVNNDGIRDLIVASGQGYPLSDAHVSVQLGKGDGFQEPISYPLGDDYFTTLEATDINSDGFLDLIVHHTRGVYHSVSVLLNQGDGSFLEPTSYFLGQDPTTLEVMDVNNDGFLDWIVFHRGPSPDYKGEVRVLLGQDDGSFGQATSYSVGDSSTSLQVNDVDNDGFLDLIVLHRGTDPDYQGDVSVLLGNAEGSFGQATSSPVGEDPTSVQVVDFNNDGFLDLITINRYSDDVSVLLGQGDGSFLEPTSYPVGQDLTTWELMDANNDGFLDIIVASEGSYPDYDYQVSVLLSQGDGTFLEPTFYTLVGTQDPPALEVVDVDNDGFLDLVIVSKRWNSEGPGSLLLGNGDGSFRTQLLFEYATGRLLEDVNNDGLLDLIVASIGSYPYRDTDVSVRLGQGDGFFLEPTSYPLGNDPISLQAVDFDGDGQLDLLLVGRDSDDVSVLLGQGDGSFQTPIHLSLDGSLVTEDINGDGYLDLLLTEPGTVCVRLGMDNGLFQDERRFAVGLGFGPGSNLTADVNSDGRLDHLDLNGGLRVLLGNGDGSVQDQRRFQVSIGSSSPVLADVNQDGRVDLLTARSVLLGNGDGSFQDERDLPVQVSDHSPLVLDVNRDGRLDLLFERYGHLRVLLSNGDGTFQEHGRFADLDALLVADVDRDGHVDLLEVLSDLGIVQVVPGDGSFQSLGPLGIDYFDQSVLIRSIVVADVNSDYHLDLVVLSSARAVFVRLGQEDGSFQEPATYTVEKYPRLLEVVDVNKDDILDLIVLTVGSSSDLDSDVIVRLGRGDGTFQDPTSYPVGQYAISLKAVDVNSDGFLDLVVLNQESDEVSVLLGQGDGSFQQPISYLVGQNPTTWELVDVNNDGFLDLIVVSLGSYPDYDYQVSVLLSQGDGTFLEPTFYTLGTSGSPSLEVVDVDNDGFLDLIIVGKRGNSEGPDSLLLGKGDGSFVGQLLYAEATARLIVDINHDGLLDLIVASEGSYPDYDSQVIVRLGLGDGFFLKPTFYSVEQAPRALEVADVNDDGVLDLLMATVGSAPDYESEVSVRLGQGDGSFQEPTSYPVGDYFTTWEMVDVNSDGFLDLIVASGGSYPDYESQVRVLLSRGDGTFLEPTSYTVTGRNPISLEVADVNSDGFLDLIVLNQYSDDMSVLLGQGDGSFGIQRRFRPVFGWGAFVEVVDVNGDGHVDLLLKHAEQKQAGLTSGLVLGNGDGSFQAPERFPVGGRPRSAETVDVNKDGVLDLVVLRPANLSSGQVSVVLGQGEGTFHPPTSYPVGSYPTGVEAVDINNDSFLDLLVLNKNSDDVSVLLGNGDGSFKEQIRFLVGDNPTSVEIVDANSDGHLDLLVTTISPGWPPKPSDDVRVLLGNGDGTFQDFFSVAVGGDPVIADVNNDGRPDLLAANEESSEVRVHLGDADASFPVFTESQATPARHTPHLVDLDGDGQRDIVLVDDQGRILFRRGLPGEANLYQPPLVVNPAAPARDLAVLRTPQGFALAASNVQGDSVSLYRWQNGTFVSAVTLPAGNTPTRLGTADLNGDGLDDVVAASSLSNSVHLFLQQPDGTFAPGLERLVGLSPVDISFADVDGRDGVDVLITNRVSGDVSVLFNDLQHSFVTSIRYRAGLSVSGMELVQGRLQPRSLEQPVSTVVADLTGEGQLDVLVVAQEARQVRLLEGTPQGGLLNPREPFRLGADGEPLPEQAGQVRAHDLDHDGDVDLAIVIQDRNEVWVYLNQGSGEFVLASRVSAGNAPTGLSMVQLNDDNGDGLLDAQDHLDLLIGNPYGDVLQVLGNGDGTFRPFVRTDQRVSLTPTDLDGDGDLDVVVANQARDNVGVYRRDGDAFSADAFQREGNELIGPGDVAVADVDGRFGSDLIFANTGSNNVLIYLRQEDGSFASQPQSFFSGTSPLALHVSQLNDDNGDGLIDDNDFVDLTVANQGSNDVNVLLGTGDDELFRNGPRMQTGGAGPIAVTTRDLTGDGIPDVLATNGQDATQTILPGLADSNDLGTGFFDEQQRAVVAISASPEPSAPLVQVLPDQGLALTNEGSVIRFEPSDGRAMVLLPARAEQPVLSFSAVPTEVGNLVVTANPQGVLNVFLEEDNVLRELASEFSGLVNPSSLVVFARSDTLLDVYLTQAGQSQPVFVPLPFSLTSQSQPPSQSGSSAHPETQEVPTVPAAPSPVVPSFDFGDPEDFTSQQDEDSAEVEGSPESLRPTEFRPGPLSESVEGQAVVVNPVVIVDLQPVETRLAGDPEAVQGGPVEEPDAGDPAVAEQVAGTGSVGQEPGGQQGDSNAVGGEQVSGLGVLVAVLLTDLPGVEATEESDPGVETFDLLQREPTLDAATIQAIREILDGGGDEDEEEPERQQQIQEPVEERWEGVPSPALLRFLLGVDEELQQLHEGSAPAWLAEMVNFQGLKDAVASLLQEAGVQANQLVQRFLPIAWVDGDLQQGPTLPQVQEVPGQMQAFERAEPTEGIEPQGVPTQQSRSAVAVLPIAAIALTGGYVGWVVVRRRPRLGASSAVRAPLIQWIRRKLGG